MNQDNGHVHSIHVEANVHRGIRPSGLTLGSAWYADIAKLSLMLNVADGHS